MVKNTNISNLDSYEMANRKFSQENDAERVYLVGGENIKLDIDKESINNAIKEAFEKVELKIEKNEQNIIEKPIYIPKIEIKEIEKQIIVPKIEYKTIEIPVITEKIITIEKPIVLKEIEIKEIEKINYNKLTKIILFGQITTLIILLISHFIK